MKWSFYIRTINKDAEKIIVHFYHFRKYLYSTIIPTFTYVRVEQNSDIVLLNRHSPALRSCGFVAEDVDSILQTLPHRRNIPITITTTNCLTSSIISRTSSYHQIQDSPGHDHGSNTYTLLSCSFGWKYVPLRKSLPRIINLQNRLP